LAVRERGSPVEAERWSVARGETVPWKPQVPQVIEFLNGKTVMRWAEVTLGL
jgi:hypothetical protein